MTPAAVLDEAPARLAPPTPARAAERLVSVLVPVPVDEPFTYEAPPSAVVGVRVEVPLGRRKVVGYVVGEAADGAPPAGVKAVHRVLDEAPIFTPDLVEATRRLARRYACPWYRMIEAAVPIGFKMRAGRGRAGAPRVVRALRLALPVAEARRRAVEGRRDDDAPPPALTAVEVLREFPLVHTAASLARRLGVSTSVVSTLRRRGIVEEVPVEVARDPFRDHPVGPDVPPDLTDEQEAALETVRSAVAAARPGAERVVVVRGVTGSGKTEVYLRAIGEVLEAGGGAIVLVPEIALTPQTVDRFRARFGDGAVALLHSGLSAGERSDEWRRLASGRARVAVGPRSAVFAPVPDLRLVVVDEEHETSYKQAEVPRYHAREAAVARARAAGAAVALGTATPSLEAEARVRAGRWGLAVLARRVPGPDGAPPPLPSVEVVDMRSELAEGNDSVFSRHLVDLLDETLERGEQAILFLNRRGTASFLLCRACGRSVRCGRCDSAMTLHRRAGNLRCHFCEARRAVPEACPGCGAPSVRPYGLGTERVEDEVRREFPKARVVRMDSDTTARRGAHREILGAFARGEADVLVGTQMIGKGLDLPRVSLVGVVAAETSLSLPDFRAAERTFHLVVQVAGRAGRASAGRVVVQTYRPDHPAILAAARHDVVGFADRETAIREASTLPPYAALARVVATAADEEAARDLAARAAEAVAAAAPEAEVVGPAPAPVERIRGEWRWAFFVRRPCAPARLDEASEALGAALAAALRRVKVPRGARLAADVDPLDVL